MIPADARPEFYAAGMDLKRLSACQVQRCVSLTPTIIIQYRMLAGHIRIVLFVS